MHRDEDTRAAAVAIELWPALLERLGALGAEHVLFGSDYPWITPDRWLADFDKIDIRDEVRPLVLKANAARLFGL